MFAAPSPQAAPLVLARPVRLCVHPSTHPIPQSTHARTYLPQHRTPCNQQDRASFLVAAPATDEVLEVDGLGSGGSSAAAAPALLGRLPCGGRAVQLGLSVSTATGRAVLAVVLESGLVELWDLDRGGGPGALIDVVHVPDRERLLKAATAGKDAQPYRCLLAGAPANEPLFFLSVLPPVSGSAAAAPAIHVLSAGGGGGGGGGASFHTQRLDAVDASRKKTPAVSGEHLSQTRPATLRYDRRSH